MQHSAKASAALNPYAPPLSAELVVAADPSRRTTDPSRCRPPPLPAAALPLKEEAAKVAVEVTRAAPPPPEGGASLLPSLPGPVAMQLAKRVPETVALVRVAAGEREERESRWQRRQDAGL